MILRVISVSTNFKNLSLGFDILDNSEINCEQAGILDFQSAIHQNQDQG